MKFLADMGISLSTVAAALRQCGHDIVHLREQGLHRMLDRDILAKARSEERVVLTFDLDFGEILALAGSLTPSVILFRLRDQSPEFVNPRLLKALGSCEADLSSGAFVTVETAGYRVRKLPLLQ